MKKKKIAVIIPIYNMEKYLSVCLDSVISQSLKDIEIICVNDGSTDQSLAILRKYESDNSNIVVIDQENMGVATARNVALDKADSEFVCFMDPDDWYPTTDILETLYNTAVRYNVNICGGSFSEYYKDGSHSERFSGNKKKYTFEESGLIFYDMYQYDYGYHRFIYNSQFLNDNNIRFPLYSRFQDPPFFVKAMVTAGKFYALNMVTYAYRVGDVNRIVWNEKRMSDMLMGLTDVLDLSSQYGLAILHNTIIERMAKSYFDRYVELLQSLDDDTKMVELLRRFDETINDSLLSNSIRNQKFNDIIPSILSAADKPYYRDRMQTTDESRTAICLEDVLVDNSVYTKKEQTSSLVSIIVPVYNVEQYLASCISSLTDQTYGNIEIVCVNDGSQDRSEDIVRKFMKRDSRIKLVCKENGGLSSARNAGIQNACGKYIIFVDSDDYLEPETIEILVQKAETTDADVVDFNAKPFFETEELERSESNYITYYNRNGEYIDTVYSGEKLLQAYHENDDFKTSACLHLIRTDMLRENNITFYEGILHEDNIFSLQLLSIAKRAAYCEGKYYCRRVRPGSIMTSVKTKKNIYGYYITCLEMYDFICANTLEDKTINAIASHLQSVERIIRSNYSKLEDRDMSELLIDSRQKAGFDLFFKMYCDTAFELDSDMVSQMQRRCKELEDEVRDVRLCHSYRIGHAILQPVRMIKRLFCRK